MLAGFLLAKLIPNIPYLRLERDIDVVAAAALGISIVLAIGVQRYVERAKYNDILKKDALMRRLQRCGDKLDAVEAACHSGTAQYVDLAASCKGCRREADAFKKYVQRVSVEGIATFVDEFVLTAQELKELLTNNSPLNEQEPMLATQAGITTIHRNRRLEIDQKIDAAHDKLREIELTIMSDMSPLGQKVRT